MRLRLNCRQRESTVTGTFCGSVVASRNLTCSGRLLERLQERVEASTWRTCAPRRSGTPCSARWPARRARSPGAPGSPRPWCARRRSTLDQVQEAPGLDVGAGGGTCRRASRRRRAPRSSGTWRRSRAMVVLPTPRMPVNRYAWCSRPESSALTSARSTGSWPSIVLEALGGATCAPGPCSSCRRRGNLQRSGESAPAASRHPNPPLPLLPSGPDGGSRLVVAGVPIRNAARIVTRGGRAPQAIRTAVRPRRHDTGTPDRHAGLSRRRHAAARHWAPTDRSAPPPQRTDPHERQDPSPSRTNPTSATSSASRSSATATRCWERPTRPGRPRWWPAAPRISRWWTGCCPAAAGWSTCAGCAATRSRARCR